MDAKALSSLLSETTSLKSAQIKTLVGIVNKYDESEELTYEAIGLLNDGGVRFDKLKEDFLAERFGWQGQPYRKHREASAFRDSVLAKPLEVREGEMDCPKCHKKQTLVVEMQTRSADEGYTYYIHCFNPKCKKITKT